MDDEVKERIRLLVEEARRREREEDKELKDWYNSWLEEKEVGDSDC